jgi:hypothetical protein
MFNSLTSPGYISNLNKKLKKGKAIPVTGRERP